MKTIAILQPMLFPWIGLFEQMQLADVWVHYDDVALSKSGFTRRVEIKTADGVDWLTIPLAGFHRGQLIRDVRLAEGDWPAGHLARLQRAYDGAPYVADMLAVANAAYSGGAESLAEVTIRSTEVIRDYYGVAPNAKRVRASTLGVAGAGSERILKIVKQLDGDVYVTGHGSKNYLDHERFDREGVRVEYMDYQLHPYTQLHGPFTPFVSALDLIANVGREGAQRIVSRTVDWRTFLERDQTTTAL